ncbi:MAG TPA: AAA family ATPase [Gemmataceae bacterium]|nr:AAA family ATPase [Gemmataceae bacterium]
MTTTLDDFYAHLRDTNPFANNRVDGPSCAEVDVPQIHEDEFQRILADAREARDHGIGVVVWGEPGLGKSQILSRLWRWADQNRWPFIYFYNLQPAPDQLPRYVLKCVLSYLTLGRARDLHDTPLYELVSGMVQAALRHASESRQPPRDVAQYIRHIKDAYQEHVSRLQEQMASSARLLLDGPTFDVLLQFYLSVDQARVLKTDESEAQSAVRWLSGESMDVEEAHRLGLKNGPGEEESIALSGTEQIQLVFVALGLLSRNQDKPLVLCFDEVENLDAPQLSALSQFLLGLLNACANLLVITCGVQDTLMRRLAAKSNEADAHGIDSAVWERLSQDKISLSLLRKEMSRAILEARLQKHLEPYRDLRELQMVVKQDSLFPLGTTWFEDRLQGLIEFRPRQIINWARERYEAQRRIMAHLAVHHWLSNWNQIGKPSSKPDRSLAESVDRKVEEKIRAQEAERLRSPHTLPPSTENLAGLVERLLGQCHETGRNYGISQFTHPAATKGQPPAYDLLVHQRVGPRSKEQTTGLLFLSTSSTQSVAASLGRLLEDRKPPQRTILVTDERQPLRPLDAKGQERWEELQKRPGFQHRVLTFAEYAALDALQQVVGMAISGDLEVEWPAGQIRLVHESEVIESHHRADRYRGHALLKELLGEKA